MPITNSPEDVSTIAKNVDARLRFDLREFQSHLYRQQFARRTSGFAQTVRRSAIKRHRLRVRLPLLADCSVIDSRRDSSGGLFFELSNRMIVRADKCLPRVSAKRWNDPKVSNPLVRKIVRSKLDTLNAAAA